MYMYCILKDTIVRKNCNISISVRFIILGCTLLFSVFARCLLRVVEIHYSSYYISIECSKYQGIVILFKAIVALV